MPQSLAQIYVHLVFSTKGRVPLIPPEVGPRLHAYLAGTGPAIQCPVLVTGGVADHVHVLFRLSKNRALSDAVKELKVESSKWMKEQGVSGFGWQAGYGAFSIGASQVEAVTDYIRNQEQQHRRRTFQEEFRPCRADRMSVVHPGLRPGLCCLAPSGHRARTATASLPFSRLPAFLLSKFTTLFGPLSASRYLPAAASAAAISSKDGARQR